MSVSMYPLLKDSAADGGRGREGQQQGRKRNRRPQHQPQVEIQVQDEEITGREQVSSVKFHHKFR